MQIDTEHNRRSFAKIVAMAWASDAFKASLLRDPVGIARENGMDLPPGTRVVVRECAPEGPNNEKERGTLELSLPPAPEDLDDERILTQTNNFYSLCAPGFVVGKNGVELALPPAPEDLGDEMILSQTNSSFIGCNCTPGFLVAGDEVELNLPPAPEDLGDEPILSRTNNFFISSAPGFIAEEATAALGLAAA